MKAAKWRKILTVVLALVFLACAVRLAYQALQYRASDAARQDAEGQASVPDLSAGEPEPPAGSDPAAEEVDPTLAALAGVDLDALRQTNADVVGWIVLPGTGISYPLLQSADNQYYLNHDWQRNYNTGGSIYLDYRCSPDFTDFHTILYGHRMANGSMFAALKYYKDLSYWQEHPNVYIVTDAAVYQYRIFAAWNAPVDSGLYVLDFASEQERARFLELGIRSSVLATELAPTPEDTILTLSTCTGYGYASRWVVQAMLETEIDLSAAAGG